MGEVWQVEWATYYGPASVVLDDTSAVVGEVVDHHTEADRPLMAIRYHGAIHWHHPRYVSPTWEPYAYAGGGDV